MSSSVPSLFAQALAIEAGRLDDLRIRAWRALGGALSMALRGGTGVPPVMLLERSDDVAAITEATATVNEQTATR